MKNKKILTGLLALSLTTGACLFSGCDDPDSSQNEESTYTIEYELNGGTNDKNNPASYKPSNPAFSFKPATKKGYTFAGWYEESNFVTPVTVIEKGERGHMKLYAKFVPESYNISYELDGGELPQGKSNPDTYSINSANITLINPTKFAYTFLGWKDEDTGTINGIRKIMKGSTGNKRYTAMWAETDYSITVESRRGTVDVVASANYDDPIEFTITPDAGYRIVEIKLNDEVMDIDDREFTMPNSNVKLNVEYAPITYNITYNLDGGENNGSNVTEYTVESDVITIARPTKEGFTFLGWKDEESGVENYTHTIAKGSTGDKTYTALWSAISYGINVTSSNGAVGIVGGAKFNDDVTFTVTPYNGYELTRIEIDGEEVDITTRTFKMPSKDVDISFYYDVIKYDVTYVLGDGVTNHEDNLDEYDVVVGLNPLPASKDGYAFVGWYVDAELTSAYAYNKNNLGPVTLYPRFAQAIINSTYYETLADAVNDAKENDVVTVFSNIKIDSKIVIDKNLTIAGVNGATIEATEDFQNGVVFSIANNGGSVKFEDITIDANEKAVVILITAGELDLKNTHITGGYSPTYVAGVYVTGTATFKMDGGSIKGNIAENTTDYYAVYSTDLWIGSQAAGTVGTISGNADLGNVFVNANEAQSDGMGTLTLNGGNVDLVYVEYDDGRGATLNYIGGTIDKLLLSTKTTGTYEEIKGPAEGIYIGGNVVKNGTKIYGNLFDAVSEAQAGDKIEVEGTHKINSKIVIDKNLTIAGVNGATIEATEDFQNGVVFSIANNGGSVKFEDITIDANSKAVVILITAGELDLKNTHITGGYSPTYVAGVYVTGTATFKMDGGSIKGNIAENTTDYYAVYSTDLWIGSQAAGTVGTISGNADLGNVFVNANEAQSDGMGTLTLNGGNIDLVYVEYDDGRGATLNYKDGEIDKLLVSTTTTGTHVQVSTPTKNTTYIGGTVENV